MAFTHGKNSRFFVDQYDLTSYFNDFTMAAKAGTAETTVYGRGAKTFIGGLKEGQISAKGFFDPGAAANDVALANALGRATNMAITDVPSGTMTHGTRCIVAYAAETDYTITAPVSGVVAVSFSAQSDSGQSTGVLLNSSDLSVTTVGAVNQGSTTVAAGSNGVNTSTFTGSGTLNVASTSGFQTAGGLIVATGGTPAFITYTGTTGTTFTGCTTVTGGGAMSTGGAVATGVQDVSAATTHGFVANLHVLSISGTAATFTAKVQHSSDGSTWADLCSFNSGSAITAAGAYSAFASYGSTVNQYLRGVIDTTGSTSITLAALISAARQ